MEDQYQPVGVYQPLDNSTQEIRVVRVLPARHFDAPVCVELNTVSLQDQPRYEALSYAWGDPKTTADIWIRGPQPTNLSGLPPITSWFGEAQSHSFQVPVTASLYGALRRLRLRCRTRILWADALCINQSNVQERNEQVRMMGHIYEAAAHVNIWLGEDQSPRTKRWRDTCPRGYSLQTDDREILSEKINAVTWTLTPLVDRASALLENGSTTLLHVWFWMLGFINARNPAKEHAILLSKSDKLFKAYVCSTQMEQFARRQASTIRGALSSTISRLCHIFRQQRTRNWRAACVREYEKDVDLAAGLDLSRITTADRSEVVVVQALRDLLLRPWFHRLWVLQESILAKRADFIVGSSVLPFQVLRKATEQAETAKLVERTGLNRSHTIAYLEQASVVSMLGIVSQQVVLLRHLQKMTERLLEKDRKYRDFIQVSAKAAGLAPPNIPNLDFTEVPDIRLPQVNALMVLSDCTGQQCADPRDKVYGLLSVSTLMPHLNVDYAKTVEQVYVDTAVAILKNKKLLPNLLFCAAIFPTTATGLPSWVPDWRGTPTSLKWKANQECFSASRIAEPQFRIDKRTRLVVRALPVDGVSACLDFTHDNVREDLQGLSGSALMDQRKEIFMQSLQSWRQWLKEHTSDTFWTVALRGMSADGKRRSTSGDCAELERFFKRDHEGKFVIPKLTLRLEDSFLHHLPFRTDRGLVGAARDMGVVGDKIYIIAGCSVPFLLRPTPVHGVNHFRLIEPCYLHGVIDGEAVTEAVLARGGCRPLDVFEEVFIV